jgi:hypothetical protein
MRDVGGVSGWVIVEWVNQREKVERLHPSLVIRVKPIRENVLVFEGHNNSKPPEECCRKQLKGQESVRRGGRGGGWDGGREGDNVKRRRK